MEKMYGTIKSQYKCDIGYGAGCAIRGLGYKKVKKNKCTKFSYFIVHILALK